jgi:uncharacterized protein (TIGR00290 family)
MSSRSWAAAALKAQPFMASWSGGKDCCLALRRAILAGGQPRLLLNMCCEDGQRSRSHGLRSDVLAAQAASLGIALRQRRTGWDDYEKNFLEVLAEIKAGGVTRGVFGDIDLAPHREWVERVCGEAGFTPHEPLWGAPRRELLEEFLGARFSATVVSVRTDVLPPAMLGRALDRELIAEIESAGADASGEGGEYHTVVTDGPLFATALRLEPGEVFEVSNYACLDLALAGAEE